MPIDWEAEARGITEHQQQDGATSIDWEAMATGGQQSAKAQATGQPEADGFSLGEMASNIPSSAAKFASDIAQPFIHPIDTAESLLNLAMGASEKIENKFIDFLPDIVKEAGDKASGLLSDMGLPTRDKPFTTGREKGHEKYPEQVAEFVKERYGSIDKFANTVEKDPVGVLADAATLLTGGGAVAAKLPSVAGRAGQGLLTAGKALEPVNIVKGASKLAASKLIPKTAPTALYESAAKFSKALPQSDRKALVKTALGHEIMPSSKGVDKLNSIIGAFNSDVDRVIEKSTKAGKMIPKKALFIHLNKLRKKLGGAKIEGATDLGQIEKVAKNMNEHLESLGKKNLTPVEVQAFKKDVYERINFDAKNLRSSIGKVGAQKSIARAAKESIEKVADVKDLNRELGKLYKLKKPIQQSSARIEDRDILGIGAPIKIGAGSAVSPELGAAATAQSILELPKVKAALAIKINKIQEAGKLNMIDHKLLPTLIRLGLLQAGKLPPADEESDNVINQ